MTKKIAVLLADGFEEIEALVPSDILARLGCDVILTGITFQTVTGSHGFKIEAKTTVDHLKAEELDAVFLPGGLPGATNLRDNPDVIRLVRELHSSGKIVSAICAAPIVLHQAGVAQNHRITGYPGSEKMAEGLLYTGERSESDRGVVTGKGPGASFDFAFRLAEALGFAPEQLKQLKNQMFVL